MAVTRLPQSAGFDTGCCRGQRTPPTEPRSRLQLWVRRTLCGSGLGRDAAAVVRRLRYRLLSGSEDPSHRSPAPARVVGPAHPLRERPWPRRGCCGPPSSIQAAVGVKTPPTEDRPLPYNADRFYGIPRRALRPPCHHAAAAPAFPVRPPHPAHIAASGSGSGCPPAIRSRSRIRGRARRR